MKEKEKRSRIVLTLCSILVGLIGLGVLLYPTVSRYYYSMMQAQMIEKYENSMHDYEKSEYEELFLMARQYNQYLYDNHISFENIEAERRNLQNEGLFYDEILNPDGNGVMGYLVIDKIDVKLPISHSIEEAVLKEGIGHLEGTSLPTDDNSVHCVLFGHRGLPSSVLLTDLDQLQEGDFFQIYVADRILIYSVDQILVVTPEETESMFIEDSKNYVTLVTCTPYGVNTHRLLVRGTLIETDKADR